MATTKPIIKTKPTTVTDSRTTVNKSYTPSSESFVFQRENYMIMLVGLVVIIIGFLLMLGVNNDNPATFPADELYSFRRITLAPIVVMIGFGIEIVAILKRPKV